MKTENSQGEKEFQNLKKSEEFGKKLFISDKIDLKEKGIIINKYIRIAHLCDMVLNKRLFLSSPKLWGDPFEYKYESWIEKDSKQNVFSVYGTCFTANTVEQEETQWKSYGNNDVVRVTFNLKELMNKIKGASFAFDVALLKMVYSERARFFCDDVPIKGDAKNKEKNKELYLNNFALKLKAYTYENEIRLCAIKDKDKTDKEYIYIEKIDFNDAIEYITLPPFNPETRADSIHDIINNHGLYLTLKELGVKADKIKQSNLYNKDEKDYVSIYKEDSFKKGIKSLKNEEKRRLTSLINRLYTFFSKLKSSIFTWHSVDLAGYNLFFIISRKA